MKTSAVADAGEKDTHLLLWGMLSCLALFENKWILLKNRY